MKLTNEQAAVVQANERRICVNAFAGTGKTSTLVAKAKAIKGKILYIVYNRSAMEEAQKRFPANTEPRTAHSLAFAAKGRPYQAKLGNVTSWHIHDVIKKRFPRHKDAMETAYIAKQCLMHYLASSVKTMPEAITEEIKQEADALSVPLTRAVHVASAVWEAAQDPDNHQIPMPHDGYLKLWQLSRPSLDQYDWIFLDEAQDTNPCLADILQDVTPKLVLVGDRHQGIYGWRGAYDILSATQGASYYLTQSFRFGPELAGLATDLLATAKGETKPIRGNPQLSTDIQCPGEYIRVPGKSVCCLFRTVTGMADFAAKLRSRNAPISFLGGPNAYNFEVILDCYSLYAHKKNHIKDPFIRIFPNIAELEDYAETTNALDIRARIQFVRKHKHATPAIIHDLLNCPPKAPILLTTAHRSKGLEFPVVILGDDFPNILDERPQTPQETEEVNLQYVAVTRASKQLTIHRGLSPLAKKKPDALPELVEEATCAVGM